MVAIRSESKETHYQDTSRFLSENHFTCSIRLTLWSSEKHNIFIKACIHITKSVSRNPISQHLTLSRCTLPSLPASFASREPRSQTWKEKRIQHREVCKIWISSTPNLYKWGYDLEEQVPPCWFTWQLLSSHTCRWWSMPSSEAHLLLQSSSSPFPEGLASQR